MVHSLSGFLGTILPSSALTWQHGWRSEYALASHLCDPGSPDSRTHRGRRCWFSYCSMIFLRVLRFSLPPQQKPTLLSSNLIRTTSDEEYMLLEKPVITGVRWAPCYYYHYHCHCYASVASLGAADLPKTSARCRLFGTSSQGRCEAWRMWRTAVSSTTHWHCRRIVAIFGRDKPFHWNTLWSWTKKYGVIPTHRFTIVLDHWCRLKTHRHQHLTFAWYHVHV